MWEREGEKVIKKGTQKRIRENGNINYQVRGKV